MTSQNELNWNHAIDNENWEQAAKIQKSVGSHDVSTPEGRTERGAYDGAVNLCIVDETRDRVHGVIHGIQVLHAALEEE